MFVTAQPNIFFDSGLAEGIEKRFAHGEALYYENAPKKYFTHGRVKR